MFIVSGSLCTICHQWTHLVISGACSFWIWLRSSHGLGSKWLSFICTSICWDGCGPNWSPGTESMQLRLPQVCKLSLFLNHPGVWVAQEYLAPPSFNSRATRGLVSLALDIIFILFYTLPYYFTLVTLNGAEKFCEVLTFRCTEKEPETKSCPFYFTHLPYRLYHILAPITRLQWDYTDTLSQTF